MLRVKNKNISFNRGEEIRINLRSNLDFKEGDFIKFRVTEINNVSNVLFEKEFMAEDGSRVILILLTPEDSRSFAEVSNSPLEYWYEIELNDKITVIGYDDFGPKKLTINPEAGAE